MPDAVAVYCPAESFDDDTNEVGIQTPWYTMAGDLFSPMMRRGYPRVSGTMVRHTILTEVGGFPPDLPSAADCELFLRVGLRGPFACNPELLAIRHNHRGQLSTDYAKQRDSYRIQARRLRQPVVRRGGYRAWARWLRWHLGEAEAAVIVLTPLEQRRAAARAAVRDLTPHLPWSAPTLWRPLLILLIGPYPAHKLRRWYRSAHRALEGGPDAPPARGHG